jgi:hypothetical protein
MVLRSRTLEYTSPRSWGLTVYKIIVCKVMERLSPSGRRGHLRQWLLMEKHHGMLATGDWRSPLLDHHRGWGSRERRSHVWWPIQKTRPTRRVGPRRIGSASSKSILARRSTFGGLSRWFVTHERLFPPITARPLGEGLSVCGSSAIG